MNTASLRSRARGGEPLIGALLRMPAEELVEMSAVAGMDFLVIDAEHGPADVTALRHHIALAQVHGVPVVVRVGTGDDRLILRALDQGAAGILAPHIDSGDDARHLVAASHYPPLGHRGFATYSRVGRFGTVPAAEHRARMLRDTLVLGMIESPRGVADVADIVDVDGVDGLMIGPGDLAAASRPGDPDVEESTRRVHDAVGKAGRLRVDIVGSPEAAERAFAEGAGMVMYNLAHVLMAQLGRLAQVGRA